MDRDKYGEYYIKHVDGIVPPATGGISHENNKGGFKMKTHVYLTKAIQASIAAGKAILEVYHSDFSVTNKSDNSPLTLADQRSHEIIMKYLSEFDIPVLSEEGKDIDYKKRASWERVWIVDPLDGTKEFIKRNDEFTVNVALISRNKPRIGVIFLPVKNILYFGAKAVGSFKAEIKTDETEKTDLLERLIALSQKLPLPASDKKEFTIAGSRSHSTPELEAFVEKSRQEHGNAEFISAGSSLKFCLVAEGRADVYPRTGPTMEWDTAAGQAVAENAGAKVVDFQTGESLTYNKENLLNPWFIVKA